MGIFILRGGELFTRPMGEHISTLTRPICKKLALASGLVLVFITEPGDLYATGMNELKPFEVTWRDTKMWRS